MVAERRSDAVASSGLGEVSRYGADCRGVALALASAFVDLDHVLGLPRRMVPLTDNDVGGFPGLTGQDRR